MNGEGGSSAESNHINIFITLGIIDTDFIIHFPDSLFSPCSESASDNFSKKGKSSAYFLYIFLSEYKYYKI
jgi:hypothetical protein